MMTSRFSSLGVLAVAFLGGSLCAASEGIVLDIPQSRFQETTTPLSSASAGEGRLAISVSSWKPGRLEKIHVNSRIDSVDAFRPDSLPYLSASYIMPVRQTFRVGSFAWKLGAGYFSLNRSGIVASDGLSRRAEQALHVFPVAAGLEFYPRILRSNGVYSYTSASFLPVVALATRSALGESAVLAGVPFEFSAGLNTRLNRFWNGLGGAELDFAGVLTLGTVQSMDLFGAGVRAGFRFPI